MTMAVPAGSAASWRSSPPYRASAERRRATALAVALVVLARPAAAEPVRVRYPEGPAHGFVVLSDVGGKPLAHGAVVQWLERGGVASRLLFHFDDGSLYDETVRFTQRPVFRVTSHHLVHHGPSFRETMDASFDRSGQYDVRHRAKPDADEETARGHVDVPADVSNGMLSTLLKNVSPGMPATVHLLTFRPKPLVLEVHLTSEGTDRFALGRETVGATRFLVQPRVPGLAGVAATVAGKQPDVLRMWIADGRAPTLVHLEGSLYAEGPVWHVDLTGPRIVH
jgi:hypothetical protein